MKDSKDCNIFQHVNIEDIKEIYLVSNTPAYLYKKFRINPSVNYLATFRDEILFKEYDLISEKSERSLIDIAKAYAIICAFTLKPYSEAKTFFSKADLSILDWGLFLKKMFIAGASSDKTISVNIPAKKSNPTNTLSKVQSNKNFFCVPPKVSVYTSQKND